MTEFNKDLFGNPTEEYSVPREKWMDTPYQVQDQNFENWTQAQEYAWKLLQNGLEYVNILIWNEGHQEYGLLQELNIERGVEPNPHFNTWTFAPYFWKTL